MFKFSYPIELRFRDIDMLGHVNNAVYITFLETARMVYMRQLGTWVNRPVILLAHTEIDYLRPIVLGERVDVLLRVSRVGKKSFDLEYEVRANGELSAKAKTVQVWFDHVLQQSVLVPIEARKKFSEFEGQEF